MRFRLLLPGIYVLALILLIVGMVLGAGHTPKAFEFLFYLIAAPCYVGDLFLPHIPGGFLVNLFLCFVTGISTYASLGVLLDHGLAKYRASTDAQRQTQSSDSKDPAENSKRNDLKDP